MSDVASCVIRFHDPTETETLSIALLSLAGQTYPDVEPIIVLQDFDPISVAEVQRLIDRTPWPVSYHLPKIVNCQALGPGDHRAALANAGMAARAGRYLAFLDYDDYLYSTAYDTLIRRLRLSEKAIAFGTVMRADVESTRQGNYTLTKEVLFPDVGKYDVFVRNQHPIHSYVIDTSLVDEKLLHFDVGRAKNEDYAFLLRILASHDWDLGAKDKIVAEYVVRVDGSNTIMAFAGGNRERWLEWQMADAYIADLKRDLVVTLSATELHQLLVTRPVPPVVQHGPLLEAEEPSPDREARSYDDILVRELSTDQLDGTDLGALDVLEYDETGRLAVAGWVASSDGMVAYRVVLATLTDAGPQLLASGNCQVPRPDVAHFLGTSAEVRGFSLSSDALRLVPLDGVSIAMIGVLRDGRTVVYYPTGIAT